jgi:hypothetical protein
MIALRSQIIVWAFTLSLANVCVAVYGDLAVDVGRVVILNNTPARADRGWYQRLKQQHEPPSNFAFKFHLSRYFKDKSQESDLERMERESMAEEGVTNIGGLLVYDDDIDYAEVIPEGQGLTLVRFSAQPESSLSL